MESGKVHVEALIVKEAAKVLPTGVLSLLPDVKHMAWVLKALTLVPSLASSPCGAMRGIISTETSDPAELVARQSASFHGRPKPCYSCSTKRTISLD